MNRFLSLNGSCTSMLLLSLLTTVVVALPSYQTRIPNGDKIVGPNKEPWPGVGHHRAPGGGARNAFGEAFAAAGNEWTLELCQADSDCDGWTNGEELGDPECIWQEGDIPQFDTGLTHPGIADTERGANANAITRNTESSSSKEGSRSVSSSCDDFDFSALPSNYANTSFLMPNYAVPTKSTTYAKFAFRMDELGLQQDAYIVRIDPVVEHSEVVHHMILYQCEQEPTDFIAEPSTLSRMPCDSMVASWAVGGRGLCMPALVGIELQVEQPWFVLDVHYDNPRGLTGIRDNSGLRLTTILKTEAEARGYQPAGWMWAGGIPFGMRIPPGREAYEVTAECDYPHLPENGVTVFAYSLHSHQTGRKLWTEVQRPIEADMAPSVNENCPKDCAARLFGRCELCFARMGCCGTFDDSRCTPTGQCCSLCAECDGCQGCYPKTDNCNPNGTEDEAVLEEESGNNIEFEAAFDLGCDTRYDFDLQETRLLAEYQTIYPTDKLVTHCVYDTTERTSVTRGGDATEDEMCIAFYLYYPVQPHMTCLQVMKSDVGDGEHVCRMPGVKVLNETTTSLCGVGSDRLATPINVAFSDMATWLQIHILCMMISMGILLPVGVLIPLAFRFTLFKADDAWFRYHRLLQTLGLLVLVAGVSAAFQGSSSTSFSEPHHKIGLIVFVCAILQPINALLRPHKPEDGEAPSTKRRAWEVLHRIVGYSTVGLAWINIFLGIELLQDWYSPSDDLVVALTSTQSVIMGLIVVGGIVGLTISFFESQKGSESGDYEGFVARRRSSTKRTSVV